jgi:hypothetical protein
LRGVFNDEPFHRSNRRRRRASNDDFDDDQRFHVVHDLSGSDRLSYSGIIGYTLIGIGVIALVWMFAKGWPS